MICVSLRGGYAPGMAEALRGLEGSRRFVAIGWASAILVVVLLLVGWIAYSATAPTVLTPAFLGTYSADYRYYLLSQPQKTHAYLAMVLSAPFLVIGLCFLILKRVDRMTFAALESHQALLLRVSAAIIVVFPFLVIISPYPVEGEPPTWLGFRWYFSAEPFFTLARLITLVVALAIFYKLRKADHKIKTRNSATALIIILIAAIAPSRFYIPGEITEEWTYAFDLNSLTQACAHVSVGNHIFINYNHVYGGYAEFLAPLLAILPRNVNSLFCILGVMNLIPWIFICLTTRILIRSASYILLSNLAFLTIEAVNLGDNYYQCTAIRLFFPALVVFFASNYLRSGRTFFFFVTTLCTSISSIWNLDTGLVIWVSWTLTLLIRRWYEFHGLKFTFPAFFALFKEAGVQVLCLIGAWTLFALYLRAASGAWPDLESAIVFQRAYASAGFHGLPIMIPDVWMVSLTFYATALVIVCLNYFKGIAGWRTHVLLMLTLMEIGAFSYFMGRSCESNLLSASFLVPLNLGMVLADLELLVRTSRLPDIARIVCLPAMMIVCWGALVMILALPNILGREEVKLATVLGPPTIPTPVEQNIQYIARNTTFGEQIFIFSNQSGIYYYTSGTSCPINAPSSSEWTSRSSFQTMIEALNQKRVKKVFFDQDVFDYPLYEMPLYYGVQRAIETHYHAVSHNPSQKITCYVANDAN